MSVPLHVALVWHHYHPVCRDFPMGRYRQPWARLYGVKDYLNVLRPGELYPDLRQTINILPSTILQLQDYALGTGFDPLLELLLSPRFTDRQKRFALENCFSAHPAHLIFPYPRYQELWEQHYYWGTEGCLERWQEQDYSDLVAWHNLCWLTTALPDRQVETWLERGRGFSLSDRQFIYAKQRQILGQVIPKHRQMQDQGKIELLGSTYTHALLPLLWDTQAGKAAHPQLLTPGAKVRWEGDIGGQLQRGRQIYEQHFYRSPRGFWAAEQAVSPGILCPIAKQGYGWLIADESILGWSLGHYFWRDAQGNVLSPQLLYQPYRLETNQGELAIVFRDQRLSDLIRYSYPTLSAQAACQDFIDHLKVIYRAQQRQRSDRPWLVTISPGENCWDAYPDQGREFLTLLGYCLTQAPWIKTTTITDFLERYPPQERIPPHQLHSGSWVEAGFTPWIGTMAQNRAWELLQGTRQLLSQHPEATPTNNPEAWEHLYEAENSCWFLCFGQQPCPEPEFDALFREHLQAVYRAVNESIPLSLLYPLPREKNPHPCHRYLAPVLDGLGNDYYWRSGYQRDINIISGDPTHHVTLKKLWYGYNHFYFYLRLDFVSTELAKLPHVHLCFFYPGRIHFISPIPLHHVPDVAPANYLFHHHLAIVPQATQATLWQAVPFHQWQRRETGAIVKLQNCLEIGVPWADLIPETGVSLRCVIFFSQDVTFQTCLDQKGIISVEVP